jgi:glutaredoxin
MLNLYIKTFCPYCKRVLEANETMKAPLNILDISQNPELREELIKNGGKVQVPYLEDTDRGISMYESLDIIDYLQSNYSHSDNVVVPEVPNVCPIE